MTIQCTLFPFRWNRYIQTLSHAPGREGKEAATPRVSFGSGRTFAHVPCGIHTYIQSLSRYQANRPPFLPLIDTLLCKDVPSWMTFSVSSRMHRGMIHGNISSTLPVRSRYSGVCGIEAGQPSWQNRRTSVQTSFCAVLICCNFTAEAWHVCQCINFVYKVYVCMWRAPMQLVLVIVRLQRHVNALTGPLDCIASCAYGTSVFEEAS